MVHSLKRKKETTPRTIVLSRLVCLMEPKGQEEVSGRFCVFSLLWQWGLRPWPPTCQGSSATELHPQLLNCISTVRFQQVVKVMLSSQRTWEKRCQEKVHLPQTPSVGSLQGRRAKGIVWQPGMTHLVDVCTHTHLGTVHVAASNPCPHAHPTLNNRINFSSPRPLELQQQEEVGPVPFCSTVSRFGSKEANSA